MTPKKPINPEECQGMVQYKETAKEVKEIRGFILTITENSVINKNNLDHMAATLKELAISNNLTHYKLFARTEKNAIGVAKVETSHKSHIENEKTHSSNKKHSTTTIISLIAVGVSLIAVAIMAKQAGLF
jgi:hypothetical protein